MLEDPFKNLTDTITSPARECFALVANDGADLTRATKALYVGDGGDIALRAIGSETDVTLTNVPSGCILPIRVRALRVSGTTAANIIGLV